MTHKNQLEINKQWRDKRKMVFVPTDIATVLEADAKSNLRSVNKHLEWILRSYYEHDLAKESEDE